jgi:hypothetical protein
MRSARQGCKRSASPRALKPRAEAFVRSLAEYVRETGGTGREGEHEKVGTPQRARCTPLEMTARYAPSLARYEVLAVVARCTGIVPRSASSTKKRYAVALSLRYSMPNTASGTR